MNCAFYVCQFACFKFESILKKCFIMLFKALKGSYDLSSVLLCRVVSTQEMVSGFLLFLAQEQMTFSTFPQLQT